MIDILFMLVLMNIVVVFYLIFVVFKEGVHWFRLRIAHDWSCVYINLLNFLLCFLDVTFVSVNVIFVSCSFSNVFGSCSALNKLLNTIWNPNVKEAETTNCTKPINSIRNISRPVVSVHSKKATYCYSPSNCFECVVKPKYIFHL